MDGPTTPRSERELGELDDVRDRDELRQRFDMLLHELRVVLPGVQILLAFLLTAPFSQRFGDLDAAGRTAYGISLVTATASVIALITPTMLHRLGERTARSVRLRLSIRLMVLGLLSLAVALMTALWSVARFVFGPTTTWWVIVPVVALLVILWGVLPLLVRHRWSSRDGG